MKKISLFLITLILLINFKPVYAKTNTFEDVVNAIENSELYKKIDNETPIGITFLDVGSVTINGVTQSTDGYVEYTYDVDESTTLTTKFNATADGIISYNFEGNKNDNTTFEQAFMDSLWIAQLINVVGTLNGYTEEEMQKWNTENNSTNNYTLERNGIEFTTFKYSGTSDDGTTTKGEMFDTLKIDINNFNVTISDDEAKTDNKESESTTQTPSQKNENSNADKEKNPQTGINFPIIGITIILIGGLSIWLYSNKHNQFPNI